MNDVTTLENQDAIGDISAIFIPTEIMEKRSLSSTAKLVFAVIFAEADYDLDGIATLSEGDIIERAGLKSIAKARKAIKELGEYCGLVQWVRDSDGGYTGELKIAWQPTPELQE